MDKKPTGRLDYKSTADKAKPTVDSTTPSSEGSEVAGIRNKEDHDRALKNLLDTLEGSMRERGYSIDVDSSGKAYIVRRDGPFPNAVVAVQEILRREGIIL